MSLKNRTALAEKESHRETRGHPSPYFRRDYLHPCFRHYSARRIGFLWRIPVLQTGTQAGT